MAFYDEEQWAVVGDTYPVGKLADPIRLLFSFT